MSYTDALYLCYANMKPPRSLFTPGGMPEAGLLGSRAQEVLFGHV